jgi:hypothetical protein
MKWIRNIIALACFLAVPLFGGPSRIYVEAFTTKADAKKLRDDLTADLRKLSAGSGLPEFQSTISYEAGDQWNANLRRLSVGGAQE